MQLAKTMYHTDLSDYDFLTYKEITMSRLENVAKYTTEENVEILRGIIEAIPDRNTMIHGDYHMKNMMYQNGETLKGLFLQLDPMFK